MKLPETLRSGGGMLVEALETLRSGGRMLVEVLPETLRAGGAMVVEVSAVPRVDRVVSAVVMDEGGDMDTTNGHSKHCVRERDRERERERESEREREVGVGG